MLIIQYLLVQVLPPFSYYFPALYWNHPSWSISAEFWTYLLFIPLLIKPNKWLALTIAVLGYIIIGIKMGTLLDTGITGDDYLLIRCLAGFSFGVFLYHNLEMFKPLKHSSIWYDSLIVLAISIAFYLLSHLENTIWIEFCLILLFGMVIIRATRSDFTFKSLLEKKSFIWVGKISYSIYLSHILVGFYVHRIATVLLGDNIDLYIFRNLLPLIILVVCLAFSNLTFKFIEQRFRYSNKNQGILVAKSQ